MKLSYQYRLLPTADQRNEMMRWLDMLRLQYNWMLAERFQWWEENRSPANSCPLICHLPLLKDKPNRYSQQSSLVSLKKERPWYADIHSQVLQDMVKRVDKAFERYTKGDCNGKRSGRPRYKGKGRYRSFTYPQASIDWLYGNKIKLPKIGLVKIVLHRPIPDGFDVKTAVVTQKADGWYVTLVIEDKSIPKMTIDIDPSWDNSIGIDLGLEKFLADSTGEFESIPHHFRKAEEKLARLQRKVAAAKKGSRARKLLLRKLARLHQKIARQRRQFHHETAKKLLGKAEVVFVEKLTVRNMSRRVKPKQDESGNFLPNGQAAQSGRNKSIADAGWSQFIDILSVKAEKAGQKVVKVNPKGTSQHCSNCLGHVPKTLADRWHSCPHCGTELDRDTNSAILIKKVGLGIASLKNAQPASARKRSPRCTA
ncbi:MAG: RNA-guided endonuclease InsQ/TnpB family protein [Cyanobacteriota bacterium]|jgi:putative transposase